MKAAAMAFALLALRVAGCIAGASALTSAGNPLGSALELVGGLEAKIQSGAEVEDKAQSKLAEWCDDALKTADADLKASQDKKGQLEALIAKASSDVDVAATSMESYASVEPTAASEAERGDKMRAKAETEQRKAQAEGDLAVVSKDLSGAQELQDSVQGFCTQASRDHEGTTKRRGTLLSAIAQAKQVLSSTVSGGTDAGSSMLMLAKQGMVASREQVRSDPANNQKAADMLTRLAYRQHSATLTQLVSKMEAVIRLGDLTGQDVFTKIKGMLTDMLSRLERESQNDISEKAFCDEQLTKNKAKKADLESEMTERNSKADEASAQAAEMAEEVKDTQAELATLAQSQAKLYAIRQEQQAGLASTKDTLNGGLRSVQNAIAAVRDYTSGGAGSIRDLLEAVDSAIAEHLTAINMEEDGSASGYDKMAHLNSITKARKEQDVKYITREQKSLDRFLMETKSDTGSTGEELSAVSEYQDQLKSRCIAQPESYKVRKERREAELQGLKDALDILEGDAIPASAALLQEREEIGGARLKRGLKSVRRGFLLPSPQ
jgi:hypothetical protein